MLPENISLLPELSFDPIQQQTLEKAFSVDFSGVNYLVEPKFQYDLYGLMVSYRHHDGDRMVHKIWDDHLNMVDVCVVWRDSASNPYLNQIEFTSGQFTCNMKTYDEQAWAHFNVEHISNNHLLSADEDIRGPVIVTIRVLNVAPV
ncbi:MAG: hypothetical protein L3J52_09875 [Proteobacteria bacterium]|nr:hypothetical protein [Pseudomonadota bacterium]